MPLSYAQLAALLAALATIGPFSIDTYLPAFPAIAAGLGASQLEVQQTLTAYLLPFSFMVLWHGALADAFGRKRVIVVAMLLFTAASAVCFVAPSIHWLWVGRALQGMSAGAGMVIGRAIVRDLLEGAKAQRLMSHVSMTFALGPAIAPILGGWIHATFGWRAVFVFLTLFGLTLALLTARYLPETLPREARQSLRPLELLRSYRQVFSSVAFLLLAGAVAFNFSGFFVYVLSAPVFLLQHLGVSERGFGWLFIPSVLGMMSGSALSARLAGKLSQPRTIGVGYMVMLVAALANVGLHASMPAALPWSVLPVMVYNFGMALAMPSLTLIALDLFPSHRGLVSSCQSFIQTSANSVAAALVVPLLWGSALGLAGGMSAFVALGLLLFSTWWRQSARLTPRP